MRRVAFLLSVALVVWAAVDIQLPFYETRPGSARPLDELVTLSAAGAPINGDLDMLTIVQATPNIAESLWIWVHPGRELSPASARTPEGIDIDVYREIQADQFANAFTTAMAVAAEQAGYEVDVRTRAVIAQVLADGPSDGLLQPGDELRSVDGVDVDSGAALVEQLQQFDEPVTVRLTVLRNDTTVDVEVALEVLEATGRLGLGVLVETLTAAVELPFDAQLGDVNVIGPSAGLMLAVTAADLLLEDDLAAGRVIAGTGSIAGDGSVGTVGGVPFKVEAAIEAGAELVLVPLPQAEEAVAAADGRIEVVGVTSLSDAIEVLRGTADGVAAAG